MDTLYQLEKMNGENRNLIIQMKFKALNECLDSHVLN